MKLEAVDRKNPSLICVATVTDIMDNRFLIHFDAWEDMYDYWCDPTSPYIHPVGWCEENGLALTPPNGREMMLMMMIEVIVMMKMMMMMMIAMMIG